MGLGGKGGDLQGRDEDLQSAEGTCLKGEVSSLRLCQQTDHTQPPGYPNLADHAVPGKRGGGMSRPPEPLT